MLGGLGKSLRLPGSRHCDVLHYVGVLGALRRRFAFVVTDFRVRIDAYHIDSKKFSLDFRFQSSYMHTHACHRECVSHSPLAAFEKVRNQSITLPTPQNALLIVQPMVEASLVPFSTSSSAQSNPNP
jgi:hypothetical protein